MDFITEVEETCCHIDICAIFFYLCKNNHITVIMALEIKAIPTLKGKEAERFVKEADKAYKNKEKTDFSKQVKIARAILKKANML